MKTTILLLAFIAALTYAAVVEIPIAKDVEISYANGLSGTFSEHKSDSYQTSCCSASNSYYIYAGFDISSLAGKNIVAAEIQFAQFLAASPAQSYMGPPRTDVNIDLRNSTSFRESPAYSDRNDPQLPISDQIIGTLNVNVATRQQNGVIDVTSVIKEAVAAGKSGFYISYGNSGGISASITVAAREANAKAIVIKVTWEAQSSTTEPPVQGTTAEPTCAACPCGSVAGKRRSGCPVCLECTTTAAPSTTTTKAPTTAAPTTEPPVQATTCAPCPCGSRAGKRRNGCPVCLECTTTAAPTTTKAPTTAAPTTEPPVQATTCAPCPCGSSPGKRRSGCPVCNVCTTTKAPTTAAPTTTTKAPTTEPPVQGTTTEPTCAACPCGSVAGKRRSGCPVCLECTTTAAPTTTTTKAPTTEPPVQGTSTTATPSSTAQISGDNNARASGAITAAIAGSAVFIAVAAMLL